MTSNPAPDQIIFISKPVRRSHAQNALEQKLRCSPALVSSDPGESWAERTKLGVWSACGHPPIRHWSHRIVTQQSTAQPRGIQQLQISLISSSPAHNDYPCFLRCCCRWCPYWQGYHGGLYLYYYLLKLLKGVWQAGVLKCFFLSAMISNLLIIEHFSWGPMLYQRPLRTSALCAPVRRGSASRAPPSTVWSPTSCARVETSLLETVLVESQSMATSSRTRTSPWSTLDLVRIIFMFSTLMIHFLTPSFAWKACWTERPTDSP